MSAEKYLPLPPALGDTLTSESHYFKKIPECDTIKIYIKEIKKIGKDSTFYKFSEDFVRFWGSEILLVKDGYKRYFQDCKETYLIKFPIKVNQTWENRFYLVSEKCTISSIDTTISFDGRTYHNCLSIKIQQYREADKYFIKVYFNEEYGLVYYVDYKSGDEIKLLKMETL
jgi:hypothetical protein